MTKRILVVDDDVDLAQSISDVLEAEGYGVSIAANGREALARLNGEDNPRLILLDMMMPVMDGWRFREEQRKTPAASIPIVTVTADGHARQKAVALGASGYLAKPLSIDSLLHEVERICGKADTDDAEKVAITAEKRSDA